MTGVKISDEFFRKLQVAWLEWNQEGSRISTIIEMIRQEFGIEQRLGWERLVLYGRLKDDDMHEHVVGWLVAIAPGIVILDTDNTDHLKPLSGLLERSRPHHNQLFSLCPFSPRCFSAHLYIWPSTFPRHRRYEVCPVWIDWQIGAGQGEMYMTLGIDPGRWNVLQPWLDKWLPRP
ncbi:MAG: hypothetical protein HY452_01805 [Parcubacteria group bacterium]|nr:hypothetical protein [Parcubacteria group bacterium]